MKPLSLPGKPLCRETREEHARRGQLTLEFLILFVAALALLSILAGSLASLGAKAGANGNDHQGVMGARSLAQAVQSSCSAGMNMSSDFSRFGIPYSVEGGHFHAGRGSRVIELEGLFDYDGTEPA